MRDRLQAAQLGKGVFVYGVNDVIEDTSSVAQRPCSSWAHVVVVSYPFSMRGALSSIPSVSIFSLQGFAVLAGA